MVSGNLECTTDASHSHLQRRRFYGGGFHTGMIKLQRVDIETCLEGVLILIQTKSDLQSQVK